jgi:hypothetical protein
VCGRNDGEKQRKSIYEERIHSPKLTVVDIQNVWVRTGRIRVDRVTHCFALFKIFSSFPLCNIKKYSKERYRISREEEHATATRRYMETVMKC